MGFNCGIIGLPNVGKSTIFSALSGSKAQIANYPFCTIEPNKGITIVPDEKLLKVAELLKKKNPIPTKIEFLDVAGLVKGASNGEGLGNKFLDNIRNTDAIIHCVRCFESDDIIHVENTVDPVRDIEIINTELFLSDISLLDRAYQKIVKLASSGDKDAKHRSELIKKLIDHLNKGDFIDLNDFSEIDQEIIREYGLITAKPVLYLCNCNDSDMENDYVKKVADLAAKQKSEFLTIAGKLEEEISELPFNERQEYLEGLGFKASGLDRLITASYRLLNLITYYTAATDLQAWTVSTGTPANKAAGKIHTDFEKGFIRAEVYTYDDLVKSGSEHSVRESGKLRSEGKDYIIKDGDIVRYLFNV